MFEPYTGPWTFDHAAHLLRRTIYGPTKQRILQAVNEGLEGTLDTLLGPPPSVDPPVYYDFDQDPYAGIGESWVGQPIPQGVPDVYFNRAKTIWNWMFIQMNRNDQTITEKLTLFWHNHFVIVDSGLPNMNWNYLMLLREFGMGDFKEFCKRITVDQCMLIYLNGTQNNAAEPNENYARELLELFTIGKGNLVAEGDYTNYTEQDIAAFARALTGWKAWNGTLQSHFAPWAHDNGTKQLSHRFDNQVIPNLGDQEYKHVIDLIFEKDEVSRHLCRRLYIWFVNYRITPEIESQIIEPMAQVLRDNNYEVKPALRALLQSQHFHDEAIRGCMIKNTFDLVFSVYNTLETFGPEDYRKENAMWLGYYFDLQRLGMAFFELPSVAGWKAYYQEPVFYRDWINSASLTLRKRTLRDMNGHIHYFDNDARGIDYLYFLSLLENPSEVNAMIDEVCSLFFPRPMTAEQKDYFKENLIPGLPDFEWTVEYNAYLDNPDDVNIQNVLRFRMFNFFQSIFGVPEFQLS